MADMEQIQIRPLRQTDFDAFYVCLDEVARERKYLGLVEAPPLESTRAWLQQGMEEGDIRLIAIQDAQVIGWCDIERSTRAGFTHSGKLGMGVLKSYRGKGLGSKLLEQALIEARKYNLERIELEVYASNLVAIQLYHKHNFSIEGRKLRARKIDNGYDDIISMALFF